MFELDPDIARATALPAELYRSEALYRRLVEQVLPASWQPVLRTEEVLAPGSVQPVVLWPGSLDEPLILTRDLQGELHALSNVCTHRGKILAEAPASARAIRCGYHGRRFDLTGCLLAAPGFEDAPDFPTPSDHLPQAHAATHDPLVFAALTPRLSLEALLAPSRERLRDLWPAPLRFDARRTRSYRIAAHWALYVDNYLEGFHIPYVHTELARTLDLESYQTDLFPQASLQTGLAAPGEPAFDLRADHPDAGRRIAAYYLWLFPSTMLNFYPWGLSVNLVEPAGLDATVVRYWVFVADETLEARGAGGDLERVEQEDDQVVASVANGVGARLYRPGRYSPRHERGVHHFHRLLAEALR